jgi:hypothetical protein
MKGCTGGFRVGSAQARARFESPELWWSGFDLGELEAPALFASRTDVDGPVVHLVVHLGRSASELSLYAACRFSASEGNPWMPNIASSRAGGIWPWQRM